MLIQNDNKNFNFLNEKFDKNKFDNFTINKNNITNTSFISPSCIRTCKYFIF